MSMIMESQTLPNIEDKEMEFTIDVMDAQFNHGGWYYLVITLHNSFIKDYSQVNKQYLTTFQAFTLTFLRGSQQDYQDGIT